MRTSTDIKTELDRAMTRRTELWRELARGCDLRGSNELARLNDRIPALWEELRIARIRERYGSPEPILRRAQTDRRLERELERLIAPAAGSRRAA